MYHVINGHTKLAKTIRMALPSTYNQVPHNETFVSVAKTLKIRIVTSQKVRTREIRDD